MQQTENLKLNLIETGDPISPVPLNENAEKIEAALRTKTGAAETAVLTQRVVELEKLHFAAGMYYGSGAEDKTIEVGFSPTAVLIWSHTWEKMILLTPELTFRSSQAEIISGGFTVSCHGTNSATVGYCTFIALGIDE